MKKNSISVLFIFVCVTFALAQTTTGRLSGVVSSPDGVLPSATIVARDNNTGKELTVVAKEDGTFLFPQLEFGTYTVTITASGFKTFIANEVKIDVGREYNLTPVLEVGSIQESVTVTAGADVVTATTAQVSNTVSQQQLLSLPLLAREPLGLTTLQSGVQSAPGKATTVNGMRTSFTNITRDGINIQDNFIRTNATDFSPNRPTIDNTAEFTVITSNQESDQGYGGAQVRLVTPRGTQDFHGALYAYNRNSAFAANNFFNNRAGRFTATDTEVIAGRKNVGDERSPRPFRNRNQFGGKIGGPLPLPNFGEGGPVFLRDKAFFFYNYEKTIDPNSATATRTILTPTARSGQFQYTRATPGAAINTTIGTATVTCPATTVANTGTCVISDVLGFARGLGFANIPATINPLIQERVISRLPAQGNFTGGDSLNTTGFRFTRATDLEQTQHAGRIDIEPTAKDTITGVYTWNLEQTLRTDLDPTFTTRPEGTLDSKNKLLSLTYRRIITPSLVNELRGGFFNSDVLFFRGSPAPANLFSLPLVSNPENTEFDQGRVVRTYNIQDNVDWIVGKHNIRFGGQMQFFNIDATSGFGIVPTLAIGTNTNSTPFFAAGNFTNIGGISDTQRGTANGLLALLGGIVSGVSQQFYVNSLDSNLYTPNELEFAPYRYRNHSLYASDRWQITNDLTFTFGLRYELFTPLKQINGVGLEPVLNADDPVSSLLDPNGRLQLIGGNAGEEGAFYKPDYNNFAPSVGFAWSPKVESGIGKFLLDKTVIRGGYSRTFGNDQIVTAISQAPGNNTGLGQVTSNVTNSAGLTPLNFRLGEAIPNPPVPTRVPIEQLTFLRNTTPPVANFAGVVFGVDPKLQTPMVEQYSFGIQREFFKNMAIEVRYVGTRSNNITRAYNVNEIDIVSNGFLADYNRARANFLATGNAFCTTTGCQPLQIFQNGGTGGPGRIAITTAFLPTFNNSFATGEVANLANTIINQGLNNHPIVSAPTRQPFVNFLRNPSAGTTVALLTNDGFYNYNSLQIELRRRFAQGLYFQANYTFSKNLTNSVTTGQFQFEPYLQNNNPDLNKQRADFDLTHVFNLNAVYQLPFGKGKTFFNQGGIVDKIFGGWEISAIVQAFSGTPITFVDPRGTLNTSGRSGRQTPLSNLTNNEIRALGGIYEANGNIYFINPNILNANGQASAGFGQTPFEGQVFFNNGPGQVGGIGRTLVNGPSYFNTNMGLIKNIRFTESMRVQFRADAFNVFNNVNFNANTQLP
ncbi:MAG: TonB-dependent receptor, partial [Acidobacteria bacterium]|nr:TonB-dependent receptor [Acidobacteriota bacterium]